MDSGGAPNLHLEDMFQYLESPDTKSRQNIRQEILAALTDLTSANCQFKPWLIHLLVDYYFRTQSKNVQEILGQVRESHSKALMDKLLDGVKSLDTRLPALQLLLYLVYKELPWCHQLMESPLFHAVLKCLKKQAPENIPQQMFHQTDTDVPMLMTSLMIVVILLPSAPVLMGQHLPQIFKIFDRLSLFCMHKPANTPDVFFLHLQVALYSLFHRLYGMYPCLFLESISKFFGQKENIHAYEEVVLPMLERVRLHPGLIMGKGESETAQLRWKNHETQDIIVSCSKLSLDLVEGSWEDSHCPIFGSVNELSKYRHAARREGQVEESGERESASQPVPVVVEESNSHLMPPCLDVGAVGESPSVLIGLSTPPSSHRNTPAASFFDASTRGGTPDTASRQATPSCVEDVDKGEKTPLSRSSSKSILQQPAKQWESGKKSGLVTPKAMVTLTPNTTPVTPSTISTAPFSSPILQTSTTPLKSQSSAFGVPFATCSPASRALNFSASGEHSEPNKDENDAQKVDNTSGLEIYVEEVEDKNSGADDASRGQSESVTFQSKEDPDDLEVEEINEMEDKFDAGGSPTSSVSTLASQADVTAESVRQFMKKVNRIRFNSLTSNSSSDQDAGPKKRNARKRTRPRSCPPFKRLGQSSQDDSESPSDTQQQQYHSGGERLSQKMKSEHVSLRREQDKGERDVGQKGEELSEASSEETSSSSQGAKSKPLLRDPVYEMFRRSTKNASTQVTPPFPPPLNPALQFLFAPAKLATCTKCSEELVVTSAQSPSPALVSTTVKGTEISLFNAWPAPELLDQYLRIGSELHAKELTHIPLTSRETVNWTHFGGVPPADEVNILRGQILLLHTQLLYERHKRLNHAKRNRRLLRKIARVATLEEQQKSLTSQINFQEQEIQQLSVSVKLLQEDNRRLSQTQESEDYHNLVHYKTALKENKDLKASSIQLKKLLVTQREDYEKLQKKLDNVQHRNEDNEKELEICKGRLANTETLKQQVFHLEKEVLLMQELQQKCQEKLHHSLPSNQVRVELTNMITSLQTQLADVLEDNKQKSKLHSTFQAMTVDMDSTIRSKDQAIVKMKEDISQMKSSHSEQLKALEERRIALVHINQKLECNIMELQCQLDQQQHREMMENLRANKVRGKPGQFGCHSNQKALSEAKTSVVTCQSIPDSAVETVEKDGEGPSVVVASDEIATQASAFIDSGSNVTSDLPSASSSVRARGETAEAIDSGVASRSSYRLDSDVSMHSVSETSIITSDSGCWQK